MTPSFQVTIALAKAAGSRAPHRRAFAPLLIGLAALLMRYAFARDAPVLLDADSSSYWGAAQALAAGDSPRLSLHRAVGYPAFLSLLIWDLGPNAHAIIGVQHILGALTAVISCLIAQATFGRVAGFMAGLMVAFSGPLLLQERYLMTETLFTFLLASGVWLMVDGVKSQNPWIVVGAGVVQGLAFLVRPIGLAAVPAACLGLIMQPGPLGRRLQLVEALVLGFALCAGPALVPGVGAGGDVPTIIGTFVYGRIARHEPSYSVAQVVGEMAVDGTPSARTDILNAAAKGQQPSEVRERLQVDLGMTEAQADIAMRDGAIEVILAQPEAYLFSTLTQAEEILSGTREDLDSRIVRGPFSADPTLRSPDAQNHDDHGASNALLSVFQPADYRGVLLLLLVVGTASAAITPAHRAGLIPTMISVVLIALSAALVGALSRYRYPLDPLLAVLIGGGAVTIGSRVHREVQNRVGRTIPSNSIREAVDDTASRWV